MGKFEIAQKIEDIDLAPEDVLQGPKTWVLSLFACMKIAEVFERELVAVLESLKYSGEGEVDDVHTSCAVKFNKRIDKAIEEAGT